MMCAVCPQHTTLLQVTFQLVRKLTKVEEVNTVPRRWAELLADGADITQLQQSYLETRQPLEWVLRQVGCATLAQGYNRGQGVQGENYYTLNPITYG
jgi:hypothetical protein